MRLGASYFPRVGHVESIATAAEAMGLDDISFGDSPLLAGELYASIMAAVKSTSRLEIVTGVTNSVTRDPVVTASGMATLAHASGGRVVCGIGRGDSAVLKIGKKPDGLRNFERYVEQVRRYLDGEIVDRDGTPSSLEWVKGLPRVPIEIVATGPKVLEIAARHADRIGLGLGADPDWVRQGVERARAAVEAAGRDPESVEIGAYIPCVLSDDTALAIEKARYISAKFANFRALGQDIENDSALPPILAKTVEFLRSNYDYDGDPGAKASTQVSDEFVEWMAIIGTGSAVVDRFKSLRDAGLAYVRLMSGFHQLPLAVQEEHHRVLAEVVVPALRDQEADLA